MNRNRVLKMFITLAIVLYCVFSIMSVANAFSWTGQISEFDNADAGSAGTSVSNVVGAAVAIMRIVGAGVAIIMIIAVAIKYMSAAPGERADFKKSSLQFIIGALIVFGSSNILATIVDFANEKIGNT